MNEPERFAPFANGKSSDWRFAHTIVPSLAFTTARQQLAVMPD
jgi:hypothetical protein